MKKVYADKSLPYSQDEVFDLPKFYDPCNGTHLLIKEDEFGNIELPEGMEADGDIDPESGEVNVRPVKKAESEVEADGDFFE
jgi:hypothetical protein